MGVQVFLLVSTSPGLEKGFLIIADKGGIIAASMPPGDLVSPEGQACLVTPPQ